MNKNNDIEMRFASLVNMFLPYIRRRVASLPVVGMESDDLIQEGLVGLCDAVYGYREGETAFGGYARVCIDNRINSALRSAARQKNTPLADYASLDDESIRSELISDYSVENSAAAREELWQLLQTIDSSLSRFEKNVLLLHIEGYSYRSIASVLRSNPKSVDNALQRARRKLKRSES